MKLSERWSEFGRCTCWLFPADWRGSAFFGGFLLLHSPQQDISIKSPVSPFPLDNIKTAAHQNCDKTDNNIVIIIIFVRAVVTRTVLNTAQMLMRRHTCTPTHVARHEMILTGCVSIVDHPGSCFTLFSHGEPQAAPLDHARVLSHPRPIKRREDIYSWLYIFMCSDCCLCCYLCL